MGMLTYMTVHGWLALSVSDSAFWVGAAAGTHGTAMILMCAVSGVLVDRLNRKWLIFSAQTIQAALGFSIAVLIFTGNITMWHVLVAAFIDGSVFAVKLPSRSTLVLDIVGEANLLRGTAANLAAITLMAIIMPTAIGFIVDRFDVAWAYVVMGTGYSISSLLLVFLRGVQRNQSPTKRPTYQDLKIGIQFIIQTPLIRSLVIMALTAGAFGWVHEFMLPVMAVKVLDSGPQGLGYLMSSGSVGGLMATLVLSIAGDVQHKQRIIILGYLGFGVFLIMFAASPILFVSMFLLAIAYFSAVSFETTMVTLIQISVPDEIRGRVMIWQPLNWGLSGASGFQSGAVAAVLGAPIAIGLGASILTLNGLRLLKSEFKKT